MHSPNSQPHGSRWTKLALIYACAIAAPLGAAALSVHESFLRGTPLALNFAIVAALTLFFGLGPGVVAIVSTTLAFCGYILTSAALLAPSSLARIGVILAVGVLIAWICNRQRTIGLRLQQALTTLHEQQDALLRSEKLAAVGRLSATVAHEINNPLESVTNLIYLASQDATLCPETRGYLADADRELARLANIARHTLTFARTSTQSGPADVRETLQGILAMFESRFTSRNGSIRVEMHSEHQVRLPAEELRQILTNLIGNACDALPEKNGAVEVRVTTRREMTQIAIFDNGIGIPKENVDKIFEPFFTTKADVGTGIGLWVTKELVHKHGGSIGLRNAPSDEWSTEFWVELPTEKAAG